MNSRVCKACGIEKPLSSSYFPPVHKIYFSHTCNKCAYERARIYQQQYSKAKYKTHTEEIAAANNRRNTNNKLTVFLHYGDGIVKCACPGCNEVKVEFLSIDHINGGGRQHRLKINKSGVMFYKWLIDNNFPTGYRVLCFNCNQSLGSYGYCPHENPELEGTLRKRKT